MQPINIFLCKTKISKENTATTKQIKYLKALCNEKGIEFPFSSLLESKKHLNKYEASKAIHEIVENGNSILFIYPKEME